MDDKYKIIKKIKVFPKQTCFQLSRLIDPMLVDRKAILFNLPDDVFGKWLLCEGENDFGFIVHLEDGYTYPIPFRFVATTQLFEEVDK